MTQASVRARNLALVFGEVLTTVVRVSRADIAAKLGMTRSTVSRLVDDLILGGLIAEGEAVGGARGRPAVPLMVRSGSVLALGLEINVERIVATLVDLTGAMVACHSVRVNTSELGLEASMARLCKLARRTLDEVPPDARVAGAMMAVPGLVDRRGQRIVRAPNLGWEGMTPSDYWEVVFRGTALPLGAPWQPHRRHQSSGSTTRQASTARSGSSSWPVTSRPRPSRRVKVVRSGRVKVASGTSRSFGWLA